MPVFSPSVLVPSPKVLRVVPRNRRTAYKVKLSQGIRARASGIVTLVAMVASVDLLSISMKTVRVGGA